VELGSFYVEPAKAKKEVHMCGASKSASYVTEAHEGEQYVVRVNDFGQGVFVPYGYDPADCVACVRGDTQMITFWNVPDRLVGHLDSEGFITGRFIEVDDPDYRLARDLVTLGEADAPTVVDLAEFAGSCAYIGVLCREGRARVTSAPRKSVVVHA